MSVTCHSESGISDSSLGADRFTLSFYPGQDIPVQLEMNEGIATAKALSMALIMFHPNNTANRCFLKCRFIENNQNNQLLKPFDFAIEKRQHFLFPINSK